MNLKKKRRAKTRLKATDIVRRAIIHAVEEREEYLRSIEDVVDEDYIWIRADTRDLIEAMKAYFVKRFGYDYWKDERSFSNSMNTYALSSESGKLELTKVKAATGK